jgi:hypothetical protein
MVLANQHRSAHIALVDRRTDDLAAPFNIGRSHLLAPETNANSTVSPCTKQQAGAHIYN